MVYLLLLDIILILPAAGIVSVCSFFAKGSLWKPVTKGILINLFLFFAFGIYSIVRALLLMGNFIG